MTSFAGLFCAMAFLLVSCGKNNPQQNGGGNEPQKDETPASVEITFEYPATQDMVDLMDLTVIYNDGSQDRSETQSSLEWTKTVSAPLPASFKFDRSVILKDGVELSADKSYSYTKHFTVFFRILNAKGEELRAKEYKNSSTSGSTTLPGDKNAKLMGENRLSTSHSFTFDKDGKCPQLDVE